MAGTLTKFSPPRMFSSTVDATRLRRPTDVLLLAVCTLGLGLIAVDAPGPTQLDTAVNRLLAELPGALGWLWQAAYGSLILWLLVLVLAPVVRRHHGRLRLLLDYLLAGLASLAMGVGWGALAGTPASTSLTNLLAPEDPTPTYLATRVALVAGVVVTASPHVTRPFRLVGRVVVLTGAVAAALLGVAHPSGVLAGLLVGASAAALVHLVLGSPSGRLSPEQVAAELAELGVEVESVRTPGDRVAGESLFVARTSQGPDLLVKVYGRDSWDSQFVGSLWNTVTRTGEKPQLSGGRMERVFHEATLTLIAERAGVPVLPIITAGLSPDRDALLVCQSPATTLAGLGAEELDEGMLCAAWDALLALQAAGLSHGRIDEHRVAVRDDGRLALADLAQATSTPTTTSRMTDRVRMLVTTALTVGPDRAVAGAMQALGIAGLAQTLPYLQSAVLNHSTLVRLNDTDWTLEDLRGQVIQATGADPLPLEQLRRVTVKSVLTLALVGIVAYSLISLVAGVDPSELQSTLDSADWSYLALGLVLSPVIQVFFSLSTLGATMSRLGYFPVLMLQYAIQFIALVLPASAARVALSVRFFQRFGIKTGAAVSIGVIDSVSGFLVQIGLFLLISLSGLPGFTADPSGSESSGTSDTGGSSDHRLLALTVVIALLWIVVTLLIPRRRRVLTAAIPRIRTTAALELKASRSAFEVVRHPRNLGLMLGGNLSAQLVQSAILGICLVAFGGSASFSQLILVNTAVSLFAGLMPVPGGIGVAEAGLTYGLQAVGVPAAVGLSTAVAFRMITFYLPPIWGAWAMKWLTRNAFV
ncbi:MAG: lysylphosphatidylglycerol synthase transmembrane domain-containing protein [Candidatus Nanopelagicales bacterium]